MTKNLFSDKGELSLSITIEKLPTDFSQQTYSIAQSTDSSTPDIDLISISDYTICIKARSESQLKYIPNINQSLSYMRCAYKFACSLPDKPLAILKSEKLDHTENSSSNSLSVNTFSVIQHINSPHELLYLELFDIINL